MIRSGITIRTFTIKTQTVEENTLLTETSAIAFKTLEAWGGVPFFLP